jgi:hypothetical protein
MTNLALPQSEALDVILTTFKRFAQHDDANERQVKYLQMRYMGFTKSECRDRAKIKQSTLNIWRHDDDFRMLDDQAVATQKEIRDQIVEYRWFRNLYLVMERDEYVLKKANGMLDEEYVDYDDDGRALLTRGSPPMSKEDWDYFHKMRAMYTPQQWSTIEKKFTEKAGDFNITQFITNMQVNSG